MSLERERLIFFAYLNSPHYKAFLLEASHRLESLPLDADLILKVWEDGFLQFIASHRDHRWEKCGVPCPLPTIVDANTGQVQRLSDLDKLSADGLVTLFAQIVKSGKVWQMRKNEGDCDVCNREYACDNSIITLLTRRLISGRWDEIENFAVLRPLIDAGVDDSTVAKVMCMAHELWGTHLWEERMAVHVDTVLNRGMSDDTSGGVTRIMQIVAARRPERELTAAFAEPAPFDLTEPKRTLLDFSVPLLRVLPVGPVFAGTEEHHRLVKFAPLFKKLSRSKKPAPAHCLRLERVEWYMEVYRLSVEALRCRNKNASTIDYLSCNRPHLRVPLDWRRTYNKMGIKCVEDLVIQQIKV